MSALVETNAGPVVLKGVDALATPTWHRLDVNEAAVELPPLPDGAVPPAQVIVPDGVSCLDAQAFRDEAGRLSVPGVDREAGTPSAADAQRETGSLPVPGLGSEAAAWIGRQAKAAGSALVFATAPGARITDPLTIRLDARQDSAAAATLDVLARESSEIAIVIDASSAQAGQGVAAVSVRVVAAPGARVRVQLLQSLHEGWTYLENVELLLDRGSFATLDQRCLGAQAAYCGTGVALAGATAGVEARRTCYGFGRTVRDFNYLIRHFGAKTTSNLLADSVLTGTSDKVFRGTIDLVKGAKGAHGHELETVLLASRSARNRSVPIILCDEDDVQGDHGATIGHLPAEQRGYLRARGLDDRQIEALLGRALFVDAAAHAADDEARRRIQRLEHALLGEMS